MNDGTARLIVVVVNGYSGKTASDLRLLKHVYLDLRPEVLPQEMGCGAASYPRPDHRCSTEDQRRIVTTQYVFEGKFGGNLMTLNQTDLSVLLYVKQGV